MSYNWEWECPKCGAINHTRNNRCYRCEKEVTDEEFAKKWEEIREWAEEELEHKNY